MHRFHLLTLSAATSVAVLFPTPASAANPSPDLSGFVPDFTQAIPFLPEGETATVGGVEVTATTNTGVPGDQANTYLHQSNTRLRTVLTFDQPIAGFEAEIRNHDDCVLESTAPADCFEDYRFVGLDEAGEVVFETSIRNTNDVLSFIPGDGPGQLSGLIATLEIDYSHDTPTSDFFRGSYLDLRLTDTSIDPESQTVAGTSGTPITATTPFETTGFAGAVTYAITDGTLPAGLQFDPATGVISGTPENASTVTVTITATGASTGVATATISFSIEAAPTPSTSTVPDTSPVPETLPVEETLPPTGSGIHLGLVGVVSLLLGALATTAARRNATH